MDQGILSMWWYAIKRLYIAGSVPLLLVLTVFIPYFVLLGIAADVRARRSPFSGYSIRRGVRGMSRFHDWFDWLGGYPVEVAKPEEVFQFYRECGFSLDRLKTVGGRLGCNEFVSTRA